MSDPLPANPTTTAYASELGGDAAADANLPDIPEGMLPAVPEPGENPEDWKVVDHIAGVVLQPHLFLRQQHVRTGETRLVTLKEGKQREYAMPVGFAYAMAIDIAQVLTNFFLPQNMALAQQVCDELNKALDRLVFYPERIPDSGEQKGGIVLRARVDGNDQPIPN